MDTDYNCSSSTAYVMRLTLDSVNDASSQNCKIISIELTSGNVISIVYAGAGTLGLFNRFDYQEASLSGYVLNKWYWIYTSRTESGLLSSTQLVGIYDTQVASFVVSMSDNWELLYYMADPASSGFMVYANGFKGYAQGFCGQLRGLVIMKGTSLTFSNAYEYLAQRQGGGSLSDLLLFMPFDSKTGQVAKDGSPNHLDGVFGASTYPDPNDPTWETSISNGIRFKSTGQPNYIQLPLLEFLGPDDSVTISFDFILNSAPSCTAPLIQRISASNQIVFGIVVRSSQSLSLFINNVECPLSITLTLGQTTTITVMCTTYGNATNPQCKAYNGVTKALSMTIVSVSSLGESETDKVFIGDPNCGFDGYIKELIIAKDGNILDITCSNCQLAISIDTSNEFCLSCSSPKKAYNGSCITSCDSGFLYESTSNQCYCPPNYYISGSSCLACSSGCDGCSSSSSNACYSCGAATPSLYLSPTGSCVSSCPSGMYAESEGLYCDPCDASCINCNGAGNTNCVGGCQSGYFQQPSPATSTCLSTCPPKYYSDGLTRTCQACDNSCINCTGPTNSQCLQCDTSYYLLGTTTCVVASGCPQGTYADVSTYTCENCNIPCSTCLSSTACITCTTGYYLQPSPNNNQCDSTCPSGYYPNSDTLTCQACMSPCTSCVGPAIGDCTAGCPTGCATCMPSTSTCSSCSMGYYLNDKQCSTQCPVLTYEDDTTHNCISCPSNCESCGAYGCSLCESSYYLYNNTCHLSCPPFAYNSTTPGSGNLTCSNCDPTCLTCVGPGPENCSLCQGGLFLFNRQCFAECPSGTYGTKLEVGGYAAVPICAPKIPVEMSLSLTNDPRQVLIQFSISVGPQYLTLFQSVLQVTLQNVSLDNSLIATTIIDNATINLALLISFYIADKTPLHSELQLGSDFDDDSTNMYTMPIKYADTQLSEYYPFNQPESTTISTASGLSTASNIGNTAVQSVVIVTGGNMAGFLVQIRLITDLIQLLQFLDIEWPPNVMELFMQAYIDPSNLFIPVCFFPAPDGYILPNITVSRVLKVQQISPIYLFNNCYVLSTLILCAVIVTVLKIWLQFKRPSIIPQKLATIGAAVDKILAWNVLLQIFISNFPLFLAYSILQLIYSNFDIRFMTFNFALAIISIISCIIFEVWALRLAWKYAKISTKSSEEAERIYYRYSSLFERIKNEKPIQLFLIPLNMLRICLMVVVVFALTEMPLISTILLCCVEALYLLYLLRYRPHKDRFEFIVTVLAEFLVLCAFLIALATKISANNNPTVESRNRLGWALISVNFAISIVTALIVAKQLLLLIILLIKKLRDSLRAKHNQVSPTLSLESKNFYQRHSSESGFAGNADFVLTKNDLSNAIDQIDSVQRLLKSSLTLTKKNESGVNIQPPERLRIESLLKNTLKMLDTSPGTQSPTVSPNTPSQILSLSDLNRLTSFAGSKRHLQVSHNQDIFPIKEIPSMNSKDSDAESVAGTIFLDNPDSNTEKQNTGSHRNSNRAEKEANNSIYQNPAENNTDNSQQGFRRYFFAIPKITNPTIPSLNLNENLAEYAKNNLFDNNRGAAGENNSDEEKPNLRRISIESYKRRRTLNFFNGDKAGTQTDFDKKVQNHVVSMQFLGTTQPNSKTSL